MYILTANVIKSSSNRKSSPTEPSTKSSLVGQSTAVPSPKPDDKIVSPKPKKRRIYENSAPVYDNRQIYAADLLQTQLDYSGKGLARGGGGGGGSIFYNLSAFTKFEVFFRSSFDGIKEISFYSYVDSVLK